MLTMKNVSFVKKVSNNNIPRGCLTSYVSGLTEESKELYELYKDQFENDLFAAETMETGETLSADMIVKYKDRNGRL